MKSSCHVPHRIIVGRRVLCEKVPVVDDLNTIYPELDSSVSERIELVFLCEIAIHVSCPSGRKIIRVDEQEIWALRIVLVKILSMVAVTVQVPVGVKVTVVQIRRYLPAAPFEVIVHCSLHGNIAN